MTRHARARTVSLLLATATLAAAGCKDGPNPAADAGGPSSATVTAAPPPRAEPTDSPGSDELRPVYPMDAGPPDPLARRFCDALYATPGRRANECCGGGVTSYTGLADECVRMLSFAVSSHAMTLSAPAIDACAEAMTKATVGCDWVTPRFSVMIPAACEQVSEGLLKEGATCRSSLECATGLHCQGLSTIDLGKCGRPKPAGRECSVALDTLATFARQDHLQRAHPECEGSCGSGKRCQPAIHAGEPCKADMSCGGALRCESGKCTAAPLPAAGEACVAACASGLRCNNGKCEPPRSEGEACSGDGDCRGFCVGGDAGAGGTCGKTCLLKWPSQNSPPPTKAPPPRPRR